MKTFIVFFNSKKISSIAFNEFDNSSELNEFIDLLFEIDRRNIEYLFVIDNKLNICYIYKANGQLFKIKKDIMPLIDIVYLAIEGDKLILEKFEDLRMLYLFPNPSSN
ncbi:hypothetical protein EOM09_07755 [bacterium]|nr:hypothetical protein [bacterium]